MTFEILGVTVLWFFLFGYVIVASIDFGAGFFNAYGLFTGKQHILSRIIERYLNPIWEVTNVFLVFFFVGIIGFFPQTAYYYGTSLLVPVSIGIILLAIRGSYYAFTIYGKLKPKVYTYLYGLTGLFIPASLSIVLTISEGGFVELKERGPVLNYWVLFTSPLTWSIVVLSIAAVLYISAVFLTWYAEKAKDQPALEILRKYALFWSVPLLIAAAGIIVELNKHNPDHYNRLVNLWWMFALSLGLYAGTVYLLWKKRSYKIAFFLLIGQFSLAFFGYGISHYPYLLYPYLSIYDSFTNQSMAIALVIAFVLGLGILIPSLYLLFKYFLSNNKYIQGHTNDHV